MQEATSSLLLCRKLIAPCLSLVGCHVLQVAGCTSYIYKCIVTVSIIDTSDTCLEKKTKSTAINNLRRAGLYIATGL